MREIFGSKWAETYSMNDPEKMAETWAKYTMDISDNKLKSGLNQCSTLEWPPVLGTFRKMCLNPVEPEYPYHKPAQIQHLKPVGDVENSIKRLAEIKEKFQTENIKIEENEKDREARLKEEFRIKVFKLRNRE
jgi:hypothetical protein